MFNDKHVSAEELASKFPVEQLKDRLETYNPTAEDPDPEPENPTNI